MYHRPELWSALGTAEDLANSGPPAWFDEHLATPGELQAFLDRHGVSVPRALGDADVASVRQLRGELRQVFTAGEEQAAVDRLNGLVDRYELRPRLQGHHQGWRWQAQPPEGAPPVAYLAARTVVALLALIAEDGLQRLHRCAADGCQGVFADTTRNRSRRYCLPQLCGNRTNLAAYRARRRAMRQRSS